MVNKQRPGKPLEVLVASLEKVLGRSPNVQVESPAHLPDRVTGERREHDVLVTVYGSHHKSMIAVECRDRSRKVTVNDVEGFWSKCQDTGADQGIIVSPKGFTKSALTKLRTEACGACSSQRLSPLIGCSRRECDPSLAE